MDNSSVVRVVVMKMVAADHISEKLFLGNSGIHRSNNSLRWNCSSNLREAHSAVSKPEHIPVVSVRRMLRGGCCRKTVEVEFFIALLISFPEGRAVERIVGNWSECLGKCLDCKAIVAKLLLETHVPISIIFQN